MMYAPSAWTSTKRETSSECCHVPTVSLLLLSHYLQNTFDDDQVCFSATTQMLNTIFLPSAYHSKCVDPWLTKTKKTCPVCKQKVVPSQGDSDSDSEEGDSGPDENEEVSESTPLLRSLASTSAHSFGTISGASRSEQDQESSEYEEELDSSDSEQEVTVETVVVQMQRPCSEDQDPPRA